jgi:hypothetical protein
MVFLLSSINTLLYLLLLVFSIIILQIPFLLVTPTSGPATVCFLSFYAFRWLIFLFWKNICLNSHWLCGLSSTNPEFNFNFLIFHSLTYSICANGSVAKSITEILNMEETLLFFPLTRQFNTKIELKSWSVYKDGFLFPFFLWVESHFLSLSLKQFSKKKKIIKKFNI